MYIFLNERAFRHRFLVSLKVLSGGTIVHASGGCSFFLISKEIIKQ